jgi:immune inhibitor A
MTFVVSTEGTGRDNLQRLTIAALAAMAFVLALAASAFAAGPMQTVRSDSLSSPIQNAQQALLQKGIQMKASGDVASDATVARVGHGNAAKYVKLAQTGHSNIFVMLAQFGATPGPAMGQIAKPDRNQDNTTIWFDGGYTPAHYAQLYFDHTPGANSVTNYYEQESSGRFNFDGSISNWVTVPHSEAYYGRNLCGGDCSLIPSSFGGGGLWQLDIDAANQWVTDQLAAGKTMADIKSYLAQFDQEDRYDYNGNGNFNEPDGYIDHFQLIHAGEGEEIGGGQQSADAIWSHRWYVYIGVGTSGPKPENLRGGFEIGAAAGHPTGYWIGDYVMEPENAGVGVIAHETGHDYGLPDEYDQTYSGTAPSAWWTIMSQGSYGSDGTNGIGNRPVDFDGYDKLLLGYLNYQVVDPFADGAKKKGTEVKLGPSEYNTKDTQGVIVKLPQKAVTSPVPAPTEGQHAAYSGAGDNWDATATHSLAVPATGGTLSFDAFYDTEQDWDYSFLEVSTDNGSTWNDVATSLSDPASAYANQSGIDADGTGISGTSGAGYLPNNAWYDHAVSPKWVTGTADLAAYKGQSVQLRFETVTDSGTHGFGFVFDNLKLGTTLVDGVEDATQWTFDGGFTQTTGTSSTNFYDDYYMIENREFLGYDTGLKTSPYISLSNVKVAHYQYDPGVLVSYWNTQYTDNQTGVHPGEGLILPIDMHQQVIKRDDGSLASTTVQVADAPLSTDHTKGQWIPNPATGKQYQLPPLPGVTTFDDRNNYFNSDKPDWGVKTPGFGVVVTLKDINDKGVARLDVAAAKDAPERPHRGHGKHSNW